MTTFESGQRQPTISREAPHSRPQDRQRTHDENYTAIHPIVCIALGLTSTVARGDLAWRIAKFTGYTIGDVMTIAGWQDKDGKVGDAFEGCNYGRVIFFDNNKAATCSSYGYQYAYRPDAVILFKQGDFKMIYTKTMPCCACTTFRLRGSRPMGRFGRWSSPFF